MPKLRLIIEIDADQKHTAAEYADLIVDQIVAGFEAATANVDFVPMRMKTWIVRPEPDGRFR